LKKVERSRHTSWGKNTGTYIVEKMGVGQLGMEQKTSRQRMLDHSKMQCNGFRKLKKGGKSGGCAKKKKELLPYEAGENTSRSVE